MDGDSDDTNGIIPVLTLTVGAVDVRMFSFLMAGSGGRRVHINPEQVVCLVDMGDERTQIVTTGLSGASSMSLIVETPLEEVANTLQGQSEPPRDEAADLIDLPPRSGASSPS